MNIYSDRAICTFIGHRKIKITDELIDNLYNTVEKLIVNKGVRVFLFGIRSEFNSLCHKAVTDIKAKYNFIKRIYVRAEFPKINTDYENYLLSNYEHTYFPEHLKNAGRAVYVERNISMIEKSNFCVFYYDENYNIENSTDQRKKSSGTKAAYRYAKTKKACIINLFTQSSADTLSR